MGGRNVKRCGVGLFIARNCAFRLFLSRRAGLVADDLLFARFGYDSQSSSWGRLQISYLRFQRGTRRQKDVGRKIPSPCPMSSQLPPDGCPKGRTPASRNVVTKNAK